MTISGIRPVWINDLTERLSRNQRIRRSLPGKGRLHIDRQLPFLCVYRRPEDFEDSGMERMVVGEAAYLKISADKKTHQNVFELITKIVDVLVQEFGVYLILEIWSTRDWQKVAPVKGGLRKPVFRIFSDLDRTPRSHSRDAASESYVKFVVSDRPSLVSVVNSR